MKFGNSKKFEEDLDEGEREKGKSAGNRCAIGIDDRSGPIKTEAGVIEVRARNKGKRLSRVKAAERETI